MWVKWLILFSFLLTFNGCGTPHHKVVKVTFVNTKGQAFLHCVDIDDEEFYVYGKIKRIEVGDLIKVRSRKGFLSLMALIICRQSGKL